MYSDDKYEGSGAELCWLSGCTNVVEGCLSLYGGCPMGDDAFDDKSEREMLTHKGLRRQWRVLLCEWVEPRGSCFPGDAEAEAVGEVVWAKCLSLTTRLWCGLWCGLACLWSRALPIEK